MIRTHVLPCSLPPSEADALNREGGRIYTCVLVRHYRVYRKSGHWLSPAAGERIEDSTGRTLLHAHSRDAAQQGFYKACTTARTLRQQGDVEVRYPYRRKRCRTTVWKNTGIRCKAGVMRLARCRGHAPVNVVLPPSLTARAARCFVEMRLVWDRVGRRYTWHLVVDDGVVPVRSTATSVAGVDLGEIHPAALTDGTSAAVISCRELRSCVPYTNKRLSILRGKQDKHTRGSSRWKRLQRRKNRFLVVDTVDEHYTSQTCPRDGHRTKPKGRVYTCHVCGFRCARDIVGAANILSRHLPVRIQQPTQDDIDMFLTLQKGQR